VGVTWLLNFGHLEAWRLCIMSRAGRPSWAVMSPPMSTRCSLPPGRRTRRISAAAFATGLVVQDLGLRLHLLAETTCSQTVSRALIPGVQAELA